MEQVAETIESGSNTIFVSNLSPTTNETTLAGFFSFCGKINDIKLTTFSGKSAEAIVTFDSPAAAKTALLLSNAMIGDRPINVAVYTGQDKSSVGGETSSLQGDDIPNKPHQTPAEDRSTTSVVASLLGAGYVLGQDAIQKARELDEKNQFTARASAAANSAKKKLEELDQQYGVSTKVTAVANDVSEKAKEVDSQYKISDNFQNIVKNVSDTIEMGLDSLQKKSKEVKESPRVQSGLDTFWSYVTPATEAIKKEFNDLKEQTNRDIEVRTRDNPPPRPPHPREAENAVVVDDTPVQQEELISFDSQDNQNQTQTQTQTQTHEEPKQQLPQ